MIRVWQQAIIAYFLALSPSLQKFLSRLNTSLHFGELTVAVDSDGLIPLRLRECFTSLSSSRSHA